MLQSEGYIKIELVGKKIRIIYMGGEPRYSGRTGVITSIDDMGQLHGTWGGLAVIPGEDSYEYID
jgi:hypothetical protein